MVQDLGLNPTQTLMIGDKVHCDVDGIRSHRDYVVSVDFITSANSGSVFLASKIKPDSLPSFKSNNFPPPSQAWQPPFPYDRKDVRWSKQFEVPQELSIIFPEEQSNTSQAFDTHHLQMTESRS